MIAKLANQIPVIKWDSISEKRLANCSLMRFHLQVVVLNGPMGSFRESLSRKGTIAVAKPASLERHNYRRRSDNAAAVGTSGDKMSLILSGGASMEMLPTLAAG